MCITFYMENANLTGHGILIVESEIARFVDALQRGIDATGAESVVIRRPEASVTARMRRLKFTAAVVNIEHAPAVVDLGVPAVVYGTPDLPKHPRTIVEALVKLLKGAA